MNQFHPITINLQEHLTASVKKNLIKGNQTPHLQKKMLRDQHLNDMI